MTDMAFLVRWIPSLAAALVLTSAALVLRIAIRHQKSRPSRPLTSEARGSLTRA